MTLQASTLLPSILTLKGSVLDILHDMQGQFIAVALGFAFSGSYWIVQQHRLAMTPSVTPLQTLLHFLFLFLFVLLPFFTGIWGRLFLPQCHVGEEPSLDVRCLARVARQGHGKRPEECDAEAGIYRIIAIAISGYCAFAREGAAGLGLKTSKLIGLRSVGVEPNSFWPTGKLFSFKI
jgi:hypothetical protein